MTPGLRRVLAAARAGDEAAFEDLWLQLQPGVSRYVRVLAPSAAAETEARVWAEVVAALPRFRGGYPAWRLSVYRTARACARGTFRTSRPAPLPLDASLADVTIGLLVQALAAMPPVLGECVVLRSAARLLPSEIAAVTGMGDAPVVTALAQGTALASAVLSSPDLQRRVERGQPLVASPVPAAPSPQVLEPLAAPATAAELAGWPAVAEAFRAVVPARTFRGFRTGRFVAIAAAAVVGLSGAAAAAYTGNLPGPLQDVAHHWFHAPPRHTASSHAPGSGSPGRPTGGSGHSHDDSRGPERGPAPSAQPHGRKSGHGAPSHGPVSPTDTPAPTTAPSSPGTTPHRHPSPTKSHGKPASTSPAGSATKSAHAHPTKARPTQTHPAHGRATRTQP